MTFTTPVLGPAPNPIADPLGGSLDPRLLAGATREELLASRQHYLMRANRAEPLAAAALDYIERDRVRDAEADDLIGRCAAENRRDAAAYEAWAARNRRDGD